MSANSDLRRFLRDHRDEPVLSVYLEARPADPAARRRQGVHLQQQVTAVRASLADASSDERALFERLMQMVLDRVPDEGAGGGGSWACFASGDGSVLELVLPPGVETSVSWGKGPTVVQFVRVAEPEVALVAQVDREHVRLTRWEAGECETLLSLDAAPAEDTGTHMSAAPRVGFHSGTRGRPGADDAQRQRREESERLLHALVKKLSSLPGPALPVVVGGAPESVAHLMKALPAAVEARTAHAESLRMALPAESALVVRSTLRALQVRRMGARAEELHDEAQANGLATTGLEHASRAAAQGAIAELIFSDHAWRAHPQEIEVLVQQALDDGATVAWAPSEEGRARLDGEADGLVAGLRFGVPLT